MKTLRMILVLVFCFGLVQLCLAQIEWEKHRDNPIFTDTTGGWTLPGASGSSILLIDSTYHMWYVGFDGTNFRIGYATSLDGFSWEPYTNNPVLNLGLPGSYEETSLTDPFVIYDGSTFHMWYSGTNITVSPWREAIGYATSTDGINWTKYSDQPVLDKGPTGSWDDTKIFGPSVFFDGSLFHMWYSGGSTGTIRHTGYATSPDGYTWTKYANNPVMIAGSFGDWDYPRATQPRVFFDGSTYHMFYSGGEWSKESIGYATSSDKITWTKNTNNPILNKGTSGSWDDYSVSHPSVKIDINDSIFRMWYTGVRSGYPAHIGYATSPIDTVTGIKDNIQIKVPQDFDLAQNYPNPFNPSTTIEFTLPKSEFVGLKVYNILGEEVSTLVSRKLNQGNHTYTFYGKNLASGIYYYQLTAGDPSTGLSRAASRGSGQRYREVKKMILLR